MNEKPETFADLISEEGYKPSPQGEATSQPDHSPPAPRDPRNNAVPPQKQPPPKRPADLTQPWKKPGVQNTEMKHLRKGQLRPCEKCDLHGKTVAEAQDLLQRFIADCRVHECSRLLVVCGRGLHSPEGRPVLRPAVCEFLYDHADVLACCPAQKRDGGIGALYVLIK